VPTRADTILFISSSDISILFILERISLGYPFLGLTGTQAFGWDHGSRSHRFGRVDHGPLAIIPTTFTEQKDEHQSQFAMVVLVLQYVILVPWLCPDTHI
jgi:hypothetical protein